jgi:hypothetical protein
VVQCKQPSSSIPTSNPDIDQMQTRDNDSLKVAKFYFDIKVTEGELSPSGDDESYYEISVFHSGGKRVFLFDVNKSSVPGNGSALVHYKEVESDTANAFGFPSTVTIRVGSKRTEVAGPVIATITNFRVQANYCPDGVGATGCNANERQRQIFTMEPGSSVEMSNFDQSPSVIPVKRLNAWLTN